MKRDESGLTLVEVLATLAIFSMVAVIIWSVFFQGFNFSEKAISKNFMLQESNILVTNLKRVHQKLIKYEIKSENCSIKVTDLTTSSQVQEFNHPSICFKILEINNVTGSGPKTIEPNKNANDISLKISVSDKNNSANSITINTFLYRVKGVDYQ
ncbi:PulJ/GspJ family protein [Neobacillus bataviensis]|uniref:PulJ/GspJ family protein n=1 Tax=Neobacillus bataviensis TaxID=220685 RepID=UPI001CBC694D|nr:prepilin-type N-terminal cleavage/methylation domain-containing protein [Neobacillus bataviensis]